MPLENGTPAPLFCAPSPVNANFALESLGGRYVLLLFLPPPSPRREVALAQVARHFDLFADETRLVFGVLPDLDSFSRATDTPGGLRWFGDFDGELRGLYRAVDGDGALTPAWCLIDPTLRILASGRLEDLGDSLVLMRRLPPAELHAGVVSNAPVLIVPRILEPGFCRELIDCYHRVGGEPSGVMRELDGAVVGVLDDFKSRRDAQIPEGVLQDGLRQRIALRLAPEIEKAFNFKATRIERYIVACYDAAEGGHFSPHRDNTTPATAHRQFAVSINLNPDFDGGDLRFPEFGSRTYRPPPGGALVFSCQLLHEATPVTHGRRYATLPFLYDEVGAQRRAAYLRQQDPQP